MKKARKLLLAGMIGAATVVVSTSASAFWGNWGGGPWNWGGWNNGWGNGWGNSWGGPWGGGYPGYGWGGGYPYYGGGYGYTPYASTYAYPSTTTSQSAATKKADKK
ncbi:MAG: hypothetical protein KDI88_17960 [Gammaproteobacteria bacterium]|nr:hypothetical protein [Gammaproteobacteria bacterium]